MDVAVGQARSVKNASDLSAHWHSAGFDAAIGMRPYDGRVENHKYPS